MKNTKSIKKIAIISSFIALSVVFSLFDGMISAAVITLIPLGAIIPRFKLGLANIVILIILSNYDFKTGLIAVLLKSVIVGLFNAAGFITGISGSLLSFFAMWVLFRLFNKPEKLYFISIAGGFFHTLGQIISGFLYYGLFRDVEIAANMLLLYAPILLVVGAITGFFMGILATRVNKVLIDHHILEKKKESME